ncbi:hypothetical protein [Streptomyces sp. NPDC014793]|uniref:hypothetical protein n=1 Tax=Streptomyces sp. NPDC014793 TaxID=3364914 RepID=UPI0036FA40C8
MIVYQWLLQGKWEKPAGEDEAGIVSVTADAVLPRIGRISGRLDVEEAGSSWLSCVGVGLVLQRDPPEHGTDLRNLDLPGTAALYVDRQCHFQHYPARPDGARRCAVVAVSASRAPTTCM